jgi:hypothetical protein
VIVKKKRNRPGFLREKGISDFPFGENFLSASSWGRGIPTLNWCPPGDGLVHHGGHSFVATSPMSNGDAITTIGAQGTIVNGVRNRTVAVEGGKRRAGRSNRQHPLRGQRPRGLRAGRSGAMLQRAGTIAFKAPC